jgi:hypothetical protein
MDQPTQELHLGIAAILHPSISAPLSATSGPEQLVGTETAPHAAPGPAPPAAAAARREVGCCSGRDPGTGPNARGVRIERAFDAQFLNSPMTTHQSNKEPSDLEGFTSSG